jgi:tripartite-type tricarboxylate transporter receptor subunit TctC
MSGRCRVLVVTMISLAFMEAGAAAGDVRTAAHYPTRPVRLIVGYPPGRPTDIVARLIGQRLTERLGQPFVVENRPGAASNIAAEAVIKSPADGYTLLLVASANAINVTYYDKLPFNFSEDVAFVAPIMRQPFVMEVHPSLPSTVPAFIAHAKTNPGKIGMASAGNGTPQHIFGELFGSMTGLRFLHIPYRGEAPALTDLLGGQVQVMFGSISASAEHIRSGRLRGLAVTSVSRSDALPEIPALAEFLSGYEASAWVGIAAPKNAAGPVVEKLNSEINVLLADANVRSRIVELGGSVLSLSPQAFRIFFRR